MFRSVIYTLLILLTFAGAILHQASPTRGMALLIVTGFSFIVVTLGGFIYDWHCQLQARGILIGRPQLDSVTFGATYFGDTPDRAKLAAQVRDLLSKYLRFPLDGLLPDDNLSDVCHAQPVIPLLIWKFKTVNLQLIFQLEETLQLGLTFDDLKKLELSITAIKTFRDLLAFVESPTCETQTAGGS